MMMLKKLRKETEVLHREIEKDNLAGLIISHSISLEEYKLLLLQNYLAYVVTEQEIAVYLPYFEAVKSSQLKNDLDSLNIKIPPIKYFRDNYSINNEAEAYGAAYVVEGSALGGMLISKELNHCSALACIEEHSFFNGKRQNTNGWKSFCKKLKNKDFSKFEEDLAVQKAKETFKFFSSIFNEVNLGTMNSTS